MFPREEFVKLTRMPSYMRPVDAISPYMLERILLDLVEGDLV